MNLPSEPEGLSPVQGMRWREAARILDSTRPAEFARLDHAEKILSVDRLRGALGDIMRLVAEASHPASDPPSIE